MTLKTCNGWIFWAAIWALTTLTAVLISWAVALHNPQHYGASSVLVALLLTTGVFGIITVIAWLIRAANENM